jgi:hypothetical protein
MTSCEIIQMLNYEHKRILESLFNTLKKKKSAKIILITQSENDTATFVQDIVKKRLLMDLLQKVNS